MSDRAIKRYVRALGGEIPARMQSRAQDIIDMETALAELVAEQAADRVTLGQIHGRHAAASATVDAAASATCAQLLVHRNRLVVVRVIATQTDR